jgi:hypothetical protein
LSQHNVAVQQTGAQYRREGASSNQPRLVGPAADLYGVSPRHATLAWKHGMITGIVKTILSSVFWLPLVVVSCTAACETRPSAGYAATLRDSAGVAIAENSAAAWSAGAAWHLADEPTLQIGVITAASPAHEFARIAGATRLSDGRIVVLEGQSAELRFYTRTGQHIVTAAGRGRGPGELGSPRSLTRLPGDTLLVDDGLGMRHVLYAANGDYVRAEALDVHRFNAAGPWTSCGGGALPEGSLLRCQPLTGASTEAGGARTGHFRPYARFVRTDLRIDTVIPLGLFGGIEQFRIVERGQVRSVVHPFYSIGTVAAGGTPASPSPRILYTVSRYGRQTDVWSASLDAEEPGTR